MATLVHSLRGPALASVLLAQWANIPTTIAADLLHGRTLVDPVLRPVRGFGASDRLAGAAVTALCEPADYGAVHHAIAVAEPGQVILIEAGARVDVAMIGELLCGSARQKGIKGVAVNGAVRDTGTLARLTDFVVFTRGITARGPASMDRGVVNDTMVFAGVHVTPGDLVLGDDDGLVIIPRGRVEELLPVALSKLQSEQQWERALSQGRTTLEVFGVPEPIRVRQDS